MLQSVQSPVHFLERSDRWLKEKPFLLDYTPQPPAVKSNAAVESHDIDIEDVRGKEHDLSFATNGFCILSVDCPMSAEDWGDDARVKDVYLRQVGDSVKQTLGAFRVQVYDYTIRKREKTFPTSTGGFYSHKQPSSVAHVDTTPACMEQMLRTMNKSEAMSLEGKRHQSVNIWKPLRGPLRDWPLALCDPRSVDSRDLQPRDTVKRENFIETFQMHHAPGQRWCYISDQEPDEAWLFLQADSSPDGLTGVPHTSFYNPLVSADDVPRESIEVRALVYYED